MSLQTLKVKNELQGRIGEIESAFAEARDDVYSLQQERSTLAKRVEELEGEMAGLKDWNAEKQNYELHETEFGSLVYSLKDGVEPMRPHHYLCEPCFNKGEKGTLQLASDTMRNPKTAQWHVVRSCPLCALKFGFEQYDRPTPKVLTQGRARGSSWRL